MGDPRKPGNTGGILPEDFFTSVVGFFLTPDDSGITTNDALLALGQIAQAEHAFANPAQDVDIVTYIFRLQDVHKRFDELRIANQQEKHEAVGRFIQAIVAVAALTRPAANPVPRPPR